MTTILVKEEDDIKKEKERTIFVITGNTSQKKKTPLRNSNDNKLFKKFKGAKKSGQNVASISNDANSIGFKRKCNFCHKFGHKKTDCHKLSAYLKKKDNPL